MLQHHPALHPKFQLSPTSCVTLSPHLATQDLSILAWATEQGPYRWATVRRGVRRASAPWGLLIVPSAWVQSASATNRLADLGQVPETLWASTCTPITWRNHGAAWYSQQDRGIAPVKPKAQSLVHKTQPTVVRACSLDPAAALRPPSLSHLQNFGTQHTSSTESADNPNCLFSPRTLSRGASDIASPKPGCEQQGAAVRSQKGLEQRTAGGPAGSFCIPEVRSPEPSDLGLVQ